MLFNLVIGFVYLFVIAFILINPITKKGDVIKKADYLIVIEWNHDLNDDIDLWVKDPMDNTVAFVNKSAGLMHLEKDDLGYSNDTYRSGQEIKIININREVVTLRVVIEGEYEVMAQVYNRGFTVKDGKPTKTLPGVITVTIIKINPYNEVYISKYPYSEIGQEISLVRFRLSEKGAYLGHNNLESSIITRKPRSMYDSYEPPQN